MAEVLEMRDVSVVRGGSRLVDAVSWTIRDGERWVVLGPNGAGKTTLLQIAATNLHPTTGTVSVLGERLGETEIADLKPRIGLSSAALADRLPREEIVRDVVLTAAYGVVGRWHEEYDIPDEERADLLLDKLGAAHLADRVFGTLSEGERKRVQIARAIMADPEMLLLDEPAAGLDLGGREDLVRRLGNLARDDAAPALVLVTHHVEEIPEGVTHVLLLREGRVVASGRIGETLTAENLSTCFGLPLSLGWEGGRWTARWDRRPAYAPV